MKYFFPRPFFVIFFALLCQLLTAQAVTKVSGTVLDKDTKEVVMFAEVYFNGTSVGTLTDESGKFELESRFASDSITVRFLGYQNFTTKIKLGEKTTVNIDLQSESIKLENIIFKEKKAKYSKKNNPAVDLTQKIIANKDKNHIKSLDFVSFDKYEKIEIDINNITEEMKKSSLLKNFQFIWDYMQTSKINGRTYLPFFIKESLSNVYYRKAPKTQKEYRHSVRASELTPNFNMDMVNSITDILVEDIDLYTDHINLLELQFVSPLSGIGPDFYRYYILDTVMYKGAEVINVAFLPAVKGNLGFMGNIYVSNDDRYSILKVDMGILKEINLNWTRDLRIFQEFEERDGKFIKTKDELMIDFGILENGLGGYVTRSLVYSNFKYEAPTDFSVFKGAENVINEENQKKNDQFWLLNRLEPLSVKEEGIYAMVDSLRRHKTYKQMIALGNFVSTGFIDFNKFEIGPFNTFFNFNQVEGFNIKLGGNTTHRFSPKWRFHGYATYPTRTQRLKFSTGLNYSFNDDFRTVPNHFIQVSADRESIFPGQDLDFYSTESVLMSFRHGDANRMMFNDIFKIDYFMEKMSYALELGLHHKIRRPLGTLTFEYEEADTGNVVSQPSINTTELFVGLKYSPNQQFLKSKTKRRRIWNSFPIIKLNYTAGISGLLGGNYDFHRLTLNFSKQYEWTSWGNTNVILEGGRVWGNVPYLLQFIPRGNQTYSSQLSSFNLMNFMEFSTDKYASLIVEHRLLGKLFNKVPLLKKLKLREVIGFKAYYGSTDADHNPLLDPNQIQFTQDKNGQYETYLFDRGPYMEASFGISNILNLFQIDLIKRFNYLDHPNIPTLFGVKGLGLRVKIGFSF